MGMGKEEFLAYSKLVRREFSLLTLRFPNNHSFNEKPALVSSKGRDLTDCHSIPFDMGHENEISAYPPRMDVLT